MADFTETLGLDISAALRDIDRLDAAINAAAVSFKAELARSVESLRDLRIELSVDAAALGRRVSAALDAADNSVTVTGDTGPLTREVTHAVDLADTNAVIEADTTHARTEVRRLGNEADRAAGGADRLRQALGLLSAATVLGAIRAVGDAASSLNEQLSGSEVVFGNFAGQVQGFAAGAERIGLAEDAALRSANAFGQLAQSAGLADAAAGAFATTITERGADIASLRDLDLSETLNALRSGLVGETEPLRDLGVFLNEATVQAEAMRLGLADATGEVDDAAKIQARYSLILQQSQIAAGNFALTSDGLANSQRILGAEFRNVIIDAGQRLQPVLADLFAEVSSLLPEFGDLASSVLPDLVRSIAAVTPLAGSFLSVAEALAPVLTVVADVLEAIPDPLLGFAGAALLGGRAIGGLTSGLGGAGGLVAQIAQLPGVLAGTASGVAGLPRLVQSLTTLNPLVLVGGVALGGLVTSLSAAAAEQRHFHEEVREATEALRDEEGVLRITSTAVGEFVETSSRFVDHRQLDDLSRLGLTFTDVGSLAREGATGLESFLRQAVRRGEVEAFNTVTQQTVDLASLGAGAYRDLAAGSAVVVNGQAIQLRGNTDLIRSFRELQGVTSTAATEELDRLRLRSAAVAGIVDEAEAHHRLADGSADVVEALQDVNQQLDRQRVAAERAQARFGPLVDQYIGISDALGRIRDESPDVARAVTDIRLGADRGGLSFIDLALSIDETALSEEGLRDVAAATKTDVDSLTGFVETVTGSIDEFVSDTVSKLPAVADVFGDTLGSAQDAARTFADSIRDTDPLRADQIIADAHVTADALAVGLLTAAADLADFRGDLAAITAGGFADLAGLIAQQGPEVGGALADELEEALAAGNSEILEGLSNAREAFETEWGQTTTFLEHDLAPQLLLTSGVLGRAVSESFGENLDFGEFVRIENAIAALEMESSGRSVALVAAVEGEAAARAYGQSFDLGQETIDAGIAAGNAIRNSGLEQAGADAGTQLATGFANGLETKMEAAARRSAEAAINGTRQVFGISSPSRVFMELGGHVGEGFALGLEAKVPRMLRTTDELLALSARANDGGHLALVGAAPAVGTPPFDDSGIRSDLRRLTGNGVQTGPITIVTNDPDQSMSELRRQLRSRQFLGR